VFEPGSRVSNCLDLLRLLGRVREALEELLHLLLLVLQVLLVVPQPLDELLAIREAPSAPARAVSVVSTHLGTFTSSASLAVIVI
jgi:hypothetical protein